MFYLNLSNRYQKLAQNKSPVSPTIGKFSSPADNSAIYANFWSSLRTWLITAMAALLLLALSSCASKPTPQEMAAADYGSYPVKYRKIVQEYYAGFLSSLSSAKYTWLKPPKRGHIFYSCGKINYGYLVRVEINITNPYKDAQRRVTRTFLLRNGRVIDRMPLDEEKNENLFCTVESADL